MHRAINSLSLWCKKNILTKVREIKLCTIWATDVVIVANDTVTAITVKWWMIKNGEKMELNLRNVFPCKKTVANSVSISHYLATFALKLADFLFKDVKFRYLKLFYISVEQSLRCTVQTFFDWIRYAFGRCV